MRFLEQAINDLSRSDPNMRASASPPPLYQAYEPVSHYIASDTEEEDESGAELSSRSVQYIEEEAKEPEAGPATVILVVLLALISMCAASIGGVL